LNNKDGPGSSLKCKENCNDVLKVCSNNHYFHRGCILNSCNSDAVNIGEQMGYSEYASYKQQQKRDKCPVCINNLIYSCEELKTSPKLNDEELTNLKTGGYKKKTRKRTKKHNKTKKNHNKTKKNKKSHKSRHRKYK
jgi:hypothetical protein